MLNGEGDNNTTEITNEQSATIMDCPAQNTRWLDVRFQGMLLFKRDADNPLRLQIKARQHGRSAVIVVDLNDFGLRMQEDKKA